MANGDVMLDDSGNVILDDAGNVMLSDGAGDDCCCSPEAVPPYEVYVNCDDPEDLRVIAISTLDDLTATGCDLAVLKKGLYCYRDAGRHATTAELETIPLLSFPTCLDDANCGGVECEPCCRLHIQDLSTDPATDHACCISRGATASASGSYSSRYMGTEITKSITATNLARATDGGCSWAGDVTVTVKRVDDGVTVYDETYTTSGTITPNSPYQGTFQVSQDAVPPGQSDGWGYGGSGGSTSGSADCKGSTYSHLRNDGPGYYDVYETTSVTVTISNNTCVAENVIDPTDTVNGWDCVETGVVQ
jgi:hypothetical protein